MSTQANAIEFVVEEGENGGAASLAWIDEDERVFAVGHIWRNEFMGRGLLTRTLRAMADAIERNHVNEL